MNTEKETLSTEENEPIAEEVQPLKELMEEIPDLKEVLQNPKCSPIYDLKKSLVAEKALMGIYQYLCSNCRNKVRDAFISLSIANAAKVIEGLDIKRFINK